MHESSVSSGVELKRSATKNTERLTTLLLLKQRREQIVRINSSKRIGKLKAAVLRKGVVHAPYLDEVDLLRKVGQERTEREEETRKLKLFESIKSRRDIHKQRKRQTFREQYPHLMPLSEGESKSDLQTQIDSCLANGCMETAGRLNDVAIARQRKQREIDIDKRIERAEKEEKRAGNGTKRAPPLLDWGFKAKERWERKSNM